MNHQEELELQQDLEFLRGRFQELSQEIKLPHSLDPEVLCQRLENLEPEPEKVRSFPKWKGLLGVAACFAFVLGAVWMNGGFVREASSGMPEMASMNLESSSAMAAAQEPNMKMAPAQTSFEMTAEDSIEETAEEAVQEGEQLPSEMDRGLKSTQPEQIESYEQARQTLPYGSYLPEESASLTYESGYVTEMSQSALYVGENRELQVSVRLYDPAQDESRLVNLEKPETYDLRLYTIPYADSVPAELAQVVEAPVFQAEEITTAVLEARLLPSQESGDEKTSQGSFSVQYGETLVDYYCVNLSPEEMNQIIVDTKAAIG